MLNEWPNDSSTMVAQFQAHTAASSYAVVLLTADDVGAPRLESDQEPYFSPRARQGVVFAMGVLVAALSPRCVCVLYEDGVESPCAVEGITYIRLDLAGTWQSKLLLQLRGAGFDYDLNGLVPVAPS
jgi:predicted nucleotide-binding protein